MYKRLLLLIVLSLLIVGCEEYPVKAYRVGEKFDASAFAEKYGCCNPYEVSLNELKYSFKEYPVTFEGVEIVIQVSDDGKILGTLMTFPCKRTSQFEEIARIAESMKGVYTDRLEACGAKKSEVVISIYYESDAEKVVVECRDIGFVERLEKNEEMCGCVVNQRKSNGKLDGRERTRDVHSARRRDADDEPAGVCRRQ